MITRKKHGAFGKTDEERPTDLASSSLKNGDGARRYEQENRAKRIVREGERTLSYQQHKKHSFSYMPASSCACIDQWCNISTSPKLGIADLGPCIFLQLKRDENYYFS